MIKVTKHKYIKLWKTREFAKACGWLLLQRALVVYFGVVVLMSTIVYLNVEDTERGSPRIQRRFTRRRSSWNGTGWHPVTLNGFHNKETPSLSQKFTSKGIGRQGVVLKHEKSLQKKTYALSSYALTYAALHSRETPEWNGDMRILRNVRGAAMHAELCCLLMCCC